MTLPAVLMIPLVSESITCSSSPFLLCVLLLDDRDIDLDFLSSVAAWIPLKIRFPLSKLIA